MRVRATLALRNAVMIERRKKYGLSQKVLAELAGVPLQFITNIEKLDFSGFDGEHTHMTLEQRLTAVAGVLEVKPEEIVPEEVRGKVFATRFVSIKNIHYDRMLQYDPPVEVQHVLAYDGILHLLRRLLPGRQMDVVEEIVLRGKTMEVLAERMNMSVNTIVEDYRVAISTLRQTAKIGRLSEDVVLTDDELSVLRTFLRLMDVFNHKAYHKVLSTEYIFSLTGKPEIIEALSTLTEREAGVIKMRYGLNEAGYEHPLEEVGRKFNVTGKRVRQIECRAAQKMREYISHKKSMEEGLA